MNSLLRQTLWITGFLLVIIVHISIISTIPWLQQSFNTLFILSALLVILGLEKRGIVLALFGGYVVDLYSSGPFGIFLFSYTVAIIALILLQRYVFKQFAPHTAAINTVLASIIFYIISGILIATSVTVGSLTIQSTTTSTYFWNAFQATSVHVVIVTLLFLFYRLLKVKLIHTPYGR